jgi:putative membrane protein insertion efficiency factor
MIKNFLLKLLTLYQRFFTLIGYGSCRYYPSCSEYARWQFEHNPLYIAFLQSFLRILRCNQLFDGGIDYPVLHSLCKKPKKIDVSHIKYWLVPKNEQRFFIIKNFNFER